MVRWSAMVGVISLGLAWLFFVNVEADSHGARSYLVAGCATKLLNVAAWSEVTGVGRTTSSKLAVRRGGVAASSLAGSSQWFSNDFGFNSIRARPGLQEGPSVFTLVVLSCSGTAEVGQKFAGKSASQICQIENQ